MLLLFQKIGGFGVQISTNAMAGHKNIHTYKQIEK